MNRWNRRLHRWGAILIAAPCLLVISTGLILQLKKEVAWVQPSTQRGSGTELRLEWSQVLAAAKSVPDSGVEIWDDIDRLDVRPSKGIIKIRCRNRWEIQIDSESGEVLSSAYRRSDLIESLHDGSFFSDYAKLSVFFLNGVGLLGLWITGIYLWYLPHKTRRRSRRKRAKLASRSE